MMGGNEDGGITFFLLRGSLEWSVGYVSLLDTVTRGLENEKGDNWEREFQ